MARRADLNNAGETPLDPMGLALAEARAAAAQGEVPVGAVIVKDGSLVAAAGNSPRALKDPSAHAEMLAIRAAGAALGDERLSAKNDLSNSAASLSRMPP